MARHIYSETYTSGGCCSSCGARHSDWLTVQSDGSQLCASCATADQDLDDLLDVPCRFLTLYGRAYHTWLRDTLGGVLP